MPVLYRHDPASKTFRLSLLWQRPMGGGQAARAILPSLLQHGTRRHRDRPALARQKERLYAAGCGFHFGRHGETAVLGLSADAVAGAFLPDRPDQFGAVLELAKEQLLEPLLHDRAALAAVFERERGQALASARAVVDDKARLARQRAVLAACSGEPYGVPDHGGEAAIAAMDPGEPPQQFVDFLAHGRAVALVSGELPADPVAALSPLLAALRAARSPSSPVSTPAVVAPARRAARAVVERAPMQQAKLVLVFRQPPVVDPRHWHALQVAWSLWGGGAHSRLFQEVRERRSLCYYASAGGDADKGLCLVQVGCDAGSAAAVVEAVCEQLAAIAAGAFAPAELATAIAACQGPYRTLDDSPGARLQFTAEQWLRGFDEDPVARVAGLQAVDTAAVAAAAAGLWLDLDYRLLPEAVP